MKNFKQERGITLIALIITIVVLLILAVVAIGAAQDSNIVGYAQNAAGKYEEGKGLENNTIAGYENILSQYANGGSNTPIGNLGKYVKYDSNGNGSVEDETILWRVLRDDSNKVELITADALGTLDLTPTDFDDARNKYNRAVELMVEECKRVTGIENNIRSIGGPAVDPTTETVIFSNLPEFEPNEGVDFSQYEGENGFKIMDNNYEEDYNQMKKAGVLVTDNSQKYWIASRYQYVAGNYPVHFMVLSVRSNGEINKNDIPSDCYSFGSIFEDGKSFFFGSVDCLPTTVRPVLTLESGILEGKTGEGTKTQPLAIY